MDQPSLLKRYRPYYRPGEVERMTARQRGKLSISREERVRQQACAFIDAVGVRCGFPRRTIATAQTLYHRFHLFFPYAEFHYIEVSLTTLYVACKLHDTLKKPRDIILASYALRFPHLVRKTAVDVSAVDPATLEAERKRVLSVERLVLETLCFAFGVAVPFPYVIKIGRRLGLGADSVRAAWRVAVDAHRTPAPLSFPPHVIALGSIYAAALLGSESTTPHAEGAKEDATIQLLGKEGPWETEYAATAGAVDEVAHALLDLYTTILSTPATDPSLQLYSPSPVSPREASRSARPSPAPASVGGTAYRLPTKWTPQALTELKIHLRERRPGEMPWDEESDGEGVEGMGRSDATVRFVWD
ncbi:cyclin-like protein [Cutaneotrichosporon oleaginosum]|uniref:Cyclin-like protein n=1 Tax=Cutaneotrichosporon oleaginosum TaxID=879819 RepID=A0A0J1BBI3_9TREE|nr:cyclin-like protein [Cutaneotrichosporon oleaginosum]KLT45359.1 cyclin-like protein [Cutaneotrichosporon oleaginosum]TXT14816.1 hypothetical protein COLE_01009 [Cutaneotrichosporon oleaginosum]